MAPVLISAFLAWSASASLAAPPDWVSDRLLVRLRGGVSDAAAAKAFADQGTEIDDVISPIDTFVLHVKPERLETVARALAHNPHFESVSKDYLRYVQLTPNDYWYPSQWHLTKIQAPQAWDLTQGSAEVTIGVIDSGVSRVNDLATKLLPGINLIAGGTDVTDGFNHGTPVAGIAAALTNNSIGVAGISPLSPILPVKVYDNTGVTTCSAITNGILWAADQGAKVINMSFAGATACSSESSAIDYAWSKGAVLVAAAGNDAVTTPYYPAAYDDVIGVAATDANDALASFSNRGSWVSVAAPGTGLFTTYNNGAYTGATGTSASSPVVAGIAALVRSANPALTNSQVKAIIEQNADDLGARGFDATYGWGRVNAYRAVAAAADVSSPPPDSTPPAASITSPAPGTLVPASTVVAVTASDDVGVSRVELHVDGALSATDTTAPYSFAWDTTKVADGSHSLTANAYDAAGNESTSDAVGVLVKNSASDTAPPAAVITSPSSGANVTKNVKIKVAASDNVRVARVEAYVDAVLVGTASCSSATCAPSFSWSANRAAKGPHGISAKAYDAAGNVAAAGVVTIYK